MNELKEASLVALRDCLNLQPGETTLVVTDLLRIDVAQELFSTASDLDSDALLLEMPIGQQDGEEPPEPVAEMMMKADVILAPTSKSITHTHARRNACKAGARVASLPGITSHIMIRTMRADYHAISQVSIALSDILTESSKVKITTPQGTDLKLSIEGRECLADTGLIHDEGDSSNLPAGEAYLAPIEGTANGIIVVDGSMAGIGKFSKGESISIIVENGNVKEISGGEKGKILETLIRSVGAGGGNIAELGIGTNNKAIVTGVVLEDEKVLGTVHIAFGNNLSMGGYIDVPLHLDGVLLNPTVEVDGKILLADGKISF
jgi:leucyl aminopeptidase (aminopeptidase T)